MSNMSDTLENKLLDHSLATAAWTKPTAVYVGLFTSTPTDAAAGTEVTGGAYARQQATFSAASGGSTSNSADITFPVATASWGTITHIGIYDAASAGTFLWWGALTGGGKTIATNDQFKIASGNLTVSMN